MNILLIHGLGRTPLSMWSLGRTLRDAGHRTQVFGYTTLLQSFDEIAARLRDRLHELSKQGPYGVVSHSLGGVLTRAALAQADFPLPAHVVMLAPPNQSPLAGRLAHQLPPFRWFAGQCGDNLASEDFYAQLPVLTCPYTIIAGTVGANGTLSPFSDEANDLIVAVKEVKMKPDDEIVQVAAVHSFIMNHADVRSLTVSAFAAF